jgi:hypothetical protein
MLHKYITLAVSPVGGKLETKRTGKPANWQTIQ